MKYIGTQREQEAIAWAKEVLGSRDRTVAARTFPPQGLCFDAVEYDSELLCVPESKFAG